MSDLTLIAELLETIFQENRQLLQELKIENVIAGCKREHPVLEPLAVSPELSVDAGALPNTEEAILAMGTMIFTVGEYIEVFMGRERSAERLSNSVSAFRSGHSDEDISGLARMLPEIFAMGDSGTVASVENLEDLEKVKNIFLHIFTRSIEKDPGIAKRIAGHLRGSESIGSVSDDCDYFEIKEGISVADAVDALSEATERSGVPSAMVEDHLAGYGDLPEELGIVSRIFKGALSNVTSFGIGPVDKLLRDGIRRDDTLILKGPAGIEKDVISTAFLKKGIEMDGCAIVVSSRCDMDSISRDLETAGVDIDKVFATERLVFVDWYSRYTERVTSLDESLGIIKVSNDLTNLAVGIDMALRRTRGHSQRRLVIDIASPTIVTEGFDRIHDFLNSVRAKLKNAKCTGLVLINPDMHTRDQTGLLDEIFDGTISITRELQHGQMKGKFRITGLAGGAYSTQSLDLTISDRGLEISGKEHGNQLLSFDNALEKASLGLPGIESVTAGGLPMGGQFLVWISTSMMPVEFVKPVVIQAQRQGLGILLAMSSINSGIVNDWTSEIGLNMRGLLDRGLLQIVDWQGQKGSKILGMEVQEGIIRTSKDVTHLGVGFDTALRNMNDQATSLAVLEILSSALRLFDLRMVYAFAQSIKAKLTQGEYTSFVLMERDAHDPGTNAAFEEIFDGVIDIRTVGDSLEIGVLSVKGTHFQPEYRTLNKMRDRLTVDVSRNISDSEIVDTMMSQGMAKKMEGLERELSETMTEKQNLERRMKELLEREIEYESRHREMKEKISEMESLMKKAGAPHPVHDPLHKKEVARLLDTMDNLLENLPQHVIDEFAKSDEFKLYEKIMDLYLEEEEQ